MKPIRFKGCNATYAENQLEYIPLPCEKFEQSILTLWEGTFWDRIHFLFHGKMWLQVMNFNRPLQPLKMDICKGYEKEHNEIKGGGKSE
jgi:hypothetical protein